LLRLFESRPFEPVLGLEFYVALHNISHLGIRRLLEGYYEEI